MRIACWTFILAAALASAAPVEERWDGTITLGKHKIPVKMRITNLDGPTPSAFFLAENEEIPSSSGTLVGDNLTLKFDLIGTVLEGKLDGGSLKGTYAKRPFEAARFCTCGFQGEAGPDITGLWKIEGGRRLSVLRKGDDTTAILSLPDVVITNPMTGRFDGAAFTLAYFNGTLTRAAVLEIEPQKDGTLKLLYIRPGEAPETQTFIAKR